MPYLNNLEQHHLRELLTLLEATAAVEEAGSRIGLASSHIRAINNAVTVVVAGSLLVTAVWFLL